MQFFSKIKNSYLKSILKNNKNQNEDKTEKDIARSDVANYIHKQYSCLFISDKMSTSYL